MVHLDETGWREEWHNVDLWTASTPEICLSHYGSRQKGMVDDLLGDQFDGTVVSDFYGPYTLDERVHQNCWAPLWRDSEELGRQHPRDPALAG